LSPTEERRTLIYPGLLDPRWLQVLFLLSFDVYALASPGFSRQPSQYLSGMAVCLLLDAAVLYFYRGLLLVPVSGLISSMGLLLLCDSPYVWPYAAVGAISILSKQLIRVDGRHVFNPLNFGIVVGLLFFSGDMTVVAGRWGGGLPGLCAVAALGALVVWRARRIDVAASYWLTFLGGALVRSALTGAAPAVVTAPMTGAAFQLFTFFMITDPMTTPEKVSSRCAFGVAVGILDNILRYNQVSQSPFFALFIISAFVPLWRRYFPPDTPEKVWQPRTMPILSRSRAKR
jgi:Na+-transporting NADH:ubiquinone oxidoreductase subunit NqrB